METRAPYVLIGTFVLAAILAVFGFVYWLNNTGGIGPAHEPPCAIPGTGAGPAGRRRRPVQRYPRW